MQDVSTELRYRSKADDHSARGRDRLAHHPEGVDISAASLLANVSEDFSIYSKQAVSEAVKLVELPKMSRLLSAPAG